jgi:hypothetical protein
MNRPLAVITAAGLMWCAVFVLAGMFWLMSGPW